MAFQEHINAWRQFQMAAGNNDIVANVTEGVIAGIKDDPSGIGTAQRVEASALGAVNETYYRLTEIAVAYGARVPNSAVR